MMSDPLGVRLGCVRVVEQSQLRPEREVALLGQPERFEP